MVFNSKGFNPNQRVGKTIYSNNSYLKCGVLPKSIRIKNKQKKDRSKDTKKKVVQILRKIIKYLKIL